MKTMTFYEKEIKVPRKIKEGEKLETYLEYLVTVLKDDFKISPIDKDDYETEEQYLNNMKENLINYYDALVNMAFELNEKINAVGQDSISMDELEDSFEKKGKKKSRFNFFKKTRKEDQEFIDEEEELDPISMDELEDSLEKDGKKKSRFNFFKKKSKKEEENENQESLVNEIESTDEDDLLIDELDDDTQKEGLVTKAVKFAKDKISGLKKIKKAKKTRKARKSKKSKKSIKTRIKESLSSKFNFKDKTKKKKHQKKYTLDEAKKILEQEKTVNDKDSKIDEVVMTDSELVKKQAESIMQDLAKEKSFKYGSVVNKTVDKEQIKSAVDKYKDNSVIKTDKGLIILSGDAFRRLIDLEVDLKVQREFVNKVYMTKEEIEAFRASALKKGVTESTTYGKQIIKEERYNELEQIEKVWKELANIEADRKQEQRDLTKKYDNLVSSLLNSNENTTVEDMPKVKIK